MFNSIGLKHFLLKYLMLEIVGKIILQGQKEILILVQMNVLLQHKTLNFLSIIISGIAAFLDFI